MCVFEAHVRYQRVSKKSFDLLSSPQLVFDFMKRRVRHAGPIEKFWVVAMNTANQDLCVRTFPGTYDRVPLDLKLIFQFLLLVPSCLGFIVCHNHPSQNLQPSKEDQRVTAKLKEASKVMGLNFHDHLILSEQGFYSFKESAMM